MNIARPFAALALSLAAVSGAGAAQLHVNPTLPMYGQPVTVELRNVTWGTYLPATRFTRSGSDIFVDFEYSPSSFGPLGPDFGDGVLRLGELAPGNYTIHARLHNLGNPKSPPETLSRGLAVVPPEQWGLYLIPKLPDAFTAFEVMVRSAVHFDPATLRSQVQGGVVRIDFEYLDNAPAGGATPPGTTTFAATKIAGLAPGSYAIEGWGRNRKTGVVEKYFTKDLNVAGAVPVVEYYLFSLDHYFVTASPEDIRQVESGMHGAWQRTGHQFKAWWRAADAPPNARPVCRFYAAGPNSHFYTGKASECDFLKSLEHSQRAEANARGQPFMGWQYEGIAFYAIIPEDGVCPGGLAPVYRAYNNRYMENDSNHRFMLDARQRSAMAVSWVDEGVAFCSAS